MRAVASVVVAVVALGACTLRPRYNELMTADLKGPTARFMVVDPTHSDAPVANARVQWGEGKLKFVGTTDATGAVELPVDAAKFGKENPVVEVVVPKGTSGYRLMLAPVAPEATEAAPSSP